MTDGAASQPSFDKLGAYEAVAQGRIPLAARPRVSVKAQLLVLASLISLADESGTVLSAVAPSVRDLCTWHDLDEREARGALRALAEVGLIEAKTNPGTCPSWAVLFPFKLAASSTARARALRSSAPPSNGQVGNHAHPANGQDGTLPHPAIRQVVDEDPPARWQVGEPVPPTQRPGVPPANGQDPANGLPANGQGVGAPSSQDPSGSLENFRSGSDLRGSGSLDPRARVATSGPASAPTHTPRGGEVAPEVPPAAPTPGPDAALDERRRAVARKFLPATDEAGWQLWEAMVRSAALREAEEADGSVEDGSLARQAAGISGKLMTSAAPLELALRAVADLVRECEAERSAAGNRWAKPNMQQVSSRLARYFGHALTNRHAPQRATAATRAPAGHRVPQESGAYDNDAARRATKRRLSAATEEGR